MFTVVTASKFCITDRTRGYLFTEWRFRVGLSSWIFELDFRVGLLSSTITNIDIDIDYIINCISCFKITNNCVIFFVTLYV